MSKHRQDGDMFFFLFKLLLFGSNSPLLLTFPYLHTFLFTIITALILIMTVSVGDMFYVFFLLGCDSPHRLDPGFIHVA